MLRIPFNALSAFFHPIQTAKARDCRFVWPRAFISKTLDFRVQPIMDNVRLHFLYYNLPSPRLSSFPSAHARRFFGSVFASKAFARVPLARRS